MLPRFRPPACSGSRDGVALVIVLAFIVLTSILIVSFIAFSSSNRLATSSYAKAIQAQEIAQGGLQDILNDLHQEIAAGSSSYTNNGSVIYVPTTNYTAQPIKLGYASTLFTNDVSSAYLPPTLVRVSRASQDGTPTDLYPPMTNAYYTGGSVPLNRASSANSASASINGRYIPAARWNKIDLLTTNSTIPPPFATNMPDWIYVTRSGSMAVTATNLTSTTSSILPSNNLDSTTQVVGRYAYAIYDESALLDINAVGYVSAAGSASNYQFNTTYGSGTNVTYAPSTNNPAGVVQTISSKTYTAYADLTQLPGLSGTQTSVIDPLIKWRSGSVSMPSSTAGATSYLLSVYNQNKNGALTFTSGDSPLLSRQDLINYFTKIDPTGTTYSAALPYLSTFSRAIMQPSWHPTDDAANLPGAYSSISGFTGTIPDPSNSLATITYINPTLFAYKSNAEQDHLTSGYSMSFPNANRDIPNVRFASAATITHYNDDGTTYTYKVQAGDPLIQYRFSLSKLAWITYNGTHPSGITDAMIQACFGLSWDATNYRWTYVGPSGSTAKSNIETLGEIGVSSSQNDTTPREPNFFELLKAGILAGSLGQVPGQVGNAGASPQNDEGIESANLDIYSSEKNRHVLQIGANIIDQYDSDSYPTALYLKMYDPTTIPAVDDLCVNTVYGDENLPGMTRMGSECVVDPYNAVTKTPYIKFWIQPELWNMHQTPATGVTYTNYPSNYRLQAFGKLNFRYTSSGGAVPQADLPAIDYDDSTAGDAYTYHGPGVATTVGTVTGTSTTTTQVPSLLYFTDGKAGKPQSAYWNTPTRLGLGNSFASFSATSNFVLNIWPTSPLAYYYGMPDDMGGSGGSFNGNQFAAFWAGEGIFPDCTTGSGTPPTSPRTGFLDRHAIINPGRPVSFAIEYQDPANSSVYHPYGFMSRLSLTICLGQTSNIRGVNYGNTVSASAANIGMSYNDNGGWLLVHVDPRTDRMGTIEAQTKTGGNVFMLDGWSIDHGNISGFGTIIGATENFFPQRTYGFVYYPNMASPAPSYSVEYLSLWTVNQPGSTQVNAFYLDPDGVVRPGDSYRRDMTQFSVITYAGSGLTRYQYGTTDTGDGCLAYHGVTAGDATAGVLPASLGTSAANTTHPTGSSQARRSVILNRPFRNVGELGYAYRDVPFKTIDFFSAESGDAALLDLFSVTDAPVPSFTSSGAEVPFVAAGQINPSNTPASGLAAILMGANKMDINDASTTALQVNNFIAASDASKIGAAITAYTNQNGPLNNRADLVTKLSDPIFNAVVGNNANYRNKAYAEAPMRALSNVTNTRTWNLLIDIIAQSGQMAPNATSLNNFVVQGERRYWLHIAIDRYTGAIVDQQLEPVYE